MGPKAVDIPFLIKDRGRRAPVYSYDGTKDYISFSEAQREIERFLNAYRMVTYRGYYSYAFNTYLKARSSKKERGTALMIRNDLQGIEDPYVLAFEKQFTGRCFGLQDVRADVERCTNFFLSSGKMDLSGDGRLCYVGPRDAGRLLFECGRVSEAYQMVVMFHIFLREFIKTDFVIPASNEDEVYLKFLTEDGIMYYVTPIKSRNMFGGSTAKTIEGAKRTLKVLHERMDHDLSDGDSGDDKYIVIVPGIGSAKFLFKDPELLSLMDGKLIYILDLESVKKTDMLMPKFVRAVI